MKQYYSGTEGEIVTIFFIQSDPEPVGVHLTAVLIYSAACEVSAF